MPGLRGVADKLAKPIDLGGPYGTRTELGAGLTHAGSQPSLESAFVHGAPAGSGRHSFQLSAAEARKISAFLDVFDTGLAPATGLLVTVDAQNAASVAAHELALLEDAAARGHCDLVYHRVPRLVLGTMAELSGWYDPGARNYRTGSRRGPRMSRAELFAEAESGLPVTFLGVPIGMGESQGVDRDVDGLWDLDELAVGTQPEWADTDADGYADGLEVLHGSNPLQASSVPSFVHRPSVVGPVRLRSATATTLDFELETDGFCRVYVAYNGGFALARLPFTPVGDHHHWVTLDELDPDTEYRMDLTLVDQCGNASLDQSAVFRTLPRATPEPSHVGAIDLSIVDPTGTPSLGAQVEIVVGAAPAGAGYGVTVAAYQVASDGAVGTLASAASATTQPDGRAAFDFPLPPAGTLPGTLHLVVLDVAPPGGGAAYARGLDRPNLSTIAY